MAINKERLQELINKGATIYTIKPIGGDVMELHLKNISDDFWYFLLGMKEEMFAIGLNTKRNGTHKEVI